MNMFSIRSGDAIYNSPMIGNGEIVTTLGPTGYHNGFCTEEEVVNRTIFWGGRRLSDARSMDIHIPRVPPEELIGSTRPLLRLGRFIRKLEINGNLTKDEKWEQSIDYSRAVVISKLDQEAIVETTESRVILNANLIIFHTHLENRGVHPTNISFQLDYEIGDAKGKQPEGMHLNIRRPHPNDLSFGNVDGIRSLESDMDSRPPHLLENLLVQYEIENQLGEVRIGRYPVGRVENTPLGGRFTNIIHLESNQCTDLWFWVTISDRLKFMHFPPTFDLIQSFLEEHEKGWNDFWQKGRVEFGESELEAVYRSSLYTLRCNVNAFAVPVGNLSTHWEGRILHDDFYAFLGLSASNHLELAERVLQNRLNTMNTARKRSQGNGTYFGWEVTEDGEESAPYGHWTDEQFRHGQISEIAWRFYLFTRKQKDLERIYPLLKGCVEWLIFDSIKIDANGNAKTRLVTDILEAVYPVKNSIYLCCAAIKALRNAARAAELLSIDEEESKLWKLLATDLQKNLPVDKEKNRYKYSDNADAPLAYAHSAMVFPFAFDLFGDHAKSTVSKSFEAFHNRLGEIGILHQSQEDAVFTDNWLWEISGLASALFYQGRGEEGLEALRRIPNIVGSFMAPCEHFRAIGGPYLPWFGTGSGIYTSAILSMFVQLLDENFTVLLPALPDSFEEAKFDNLLTAQMVEVSGRVSSGKLVELIAQSTTDQWWGFRIPIKRITEREIQKLNSIEEKIDNGYLTIKVRLIKGKNQLI